MRHVALARFEWRRSMRSPGVWIATVAYATLLTAGTAVPALVLDGADSALGTAYLHGPATEVVLPIIAIVLTYGAIAGPREQGSIKLLLSMPLDRRDVFLGVLLGRLFLVIAIVTVGTLVAVVGLFAMYGMPPVSGVIGFVAVTLLAGGAFVALGVGVSAAVASRSQAIALLLGGFVLAHALWEPIIRGAHAVVVGDTGDRTPGWIEWLRWINPLQASRRLTDGVLPPSPHLSIVVDESGVTAAPGEMVGGTIGTGEVVIGVAVLIGWSLVVLLLGYRRFQRAGLA